MYRRLSTYYLSVNRNKRSFALDLSNEKGRGIARTLAKDWADVVVENFKPGTMKVRIFITFRLLVYSLLLIILLLYAENGFGL